MADYKKLFGQIEAREKRVIANALALANGDQSEALSTTSRSTGSIFHEEWRSQQKKSKARLVLVSRHM
jgi:hypothetical protein